MKKLVNKKHIQKNVTAGAVEVGVGIGYIFGILVIGVSVYFAFMNNVLAGMSIESKLNELFCETLGILFYYVISSVLKVLFLKYKSGLNNLICLIDCKLIFNPMCTYFLFFVYYILVYYLIGDNLIYYALNGLMLDGVTFFNKVLNDVMLESVKLLNSILNFLISHNLISEPVDNSMLITVEGVEIPATAIQNGENILSMKKIGTEIAKSAFQSGGGKGALSNATGAVINSLYYFEDLIGLDKNPSEAKYISCFKNIKESTENLNSHLEEKKNSLGYDPIEISHLSYVIKTSASNLEKIASFENSNNSYEKNIFQCAEKSEFSNNYTLLDNYISKIRNGNTSTINEMPAFQKNNVKILSGCYQSELPEHKNFSPIASHLNVVYERDGVTYVHTVTKNPIHWLKIAERSIPCNNIPFAEIPKSNQTVLGFPFAEKPKSNQTVLGFFSRKPNAFEEHPLLQQENLLNKVNSSKKNIFNILSDSLSKSCFASSNNICRDLQSISNDKLDELIEKTIIHGKNQDLETMILEICYSRNIKVTDEQIEEAVERHNLDKCYGIKKNIKK